MYTRTRSDRHVNLRPNSDGWDVLLGDQPIGRVARVPRPRGYRYVPMTTRLVSLDEPLKTRKAAVVVVLDVHERRTQ